MSSMGNSLVSWVPSTSAFCVQGFGETCGTTSVQAGGGPTGHAEPLPYHLLHQSSGTSAASGLTEHQAGLRHINTRKRATCFTAASPRQAPAQPSKPSETALIVHSLSLVSDNILLPTCNVHIWPDWLLLCIAHTQKLKLVLHHNHVLRIQVLAIVFASVWAE